MYYNRNLITAEKHELTLTTGSGIFDLQSQAVFKNENVWSNVVDDITYTIISQGDVFTLRSAGTVDYTVDWGDGQTETISTANDADANLKEHTYTSKGIYTIKVNINSGVWRPYQNNANDGDFIFSIVINKNVDLGTNFQYAYRGLARIFSNFLCSFSATSGVTNFYGAWQNCGLTTFPLIDTSSATILRLAWYSCSSLTSFPPLNTANVTSFRSTWQSCINIRVFSVLNYSSGTDFQATWASCRNLTSFPELPSSHRFLAARTFKGAWNACKLLINFPANMFDTTGTLYDSAFQDAWKDCALTAQSIENILTSLVTNGATDITLDINSGNNAAYSTWSSAAQTALTTLQSRSWNVTYNT